MPERRCIAGGAGGAKSGMIRFVVGPDGDLVADIAEKLPGRGIWVTADRSLLTKAVTKGLFDRAAKMPVKVPSDLIETVESALAARLIGRVSIARKAGQAVAGSQKVKDWLSRGDAALLLQASDGSTREKSRMRPPDGPESKIEILNASEIGLAFGREHVIHAALAAGGLAKGIREDAMRLSGVRDLDGGKPPGR